MPLALVALLKPPGEVVKHLLQAVGLLQYGASAPHTVLSSETACYMTSCMLPGLLPRKKEAVVLPGLQGCTCCTILHVQMAFVWPRTSHHA